MAKKGTKTGIRDLLPKAREAREVSGGNFHDFMPTTQLSTVTIRPADATKAGGEVVNSDAYVRAR